MRLKASVSGQIAPFIVGQTVKVTNRVGESLLSGGALIEASNALIRKLGGRHTSAATFPYDQTLINQAVTQGNPILDAAGYTNARFGLNDGIEIRLPAGLTQFELVTIDGGTPTNLIVEIDGSRTNDDGYPSGQTFSGGLLHSLIELQPSARARTVRVWYANRALRGIRLPADASLARLSSGQASVVFIGDSITEGTGASHILKSWPMQAAHRLGLGNPIMSAIGGTGYIRRRGEQYNFLDRPEDVLAAVGDGPPDAVVIAGGINDCGFDGTDYSASEIGAAALSYFRTLRSGAPNMEIIVVAPFSGYGWVPYPSHLVACRNAIFSSAMQVERVFTVDTAGWITVENRDSMFDQDIDGVHPNDGGHAIYGEKAAAAIRQIILGL